MKQLFSGLWVGLQQLLFCRLFSLSEIIYFVTACPLFKMLATKHYGVWAFDVYLIMCFTGWAVVVWVNQKMEKRIPPVKFVD